MIGIIGKKLGMSQIFRESGEVVPVTVVQAGPCPVIQVKSKKTDGYVAVQLGFEKKVERLMKKPELGRFKAVKVEPLRYVAEIRDFDPATAKTGENITVEIFKEGDIVKVTGTSKGKGFQGTVKRHNFRGGPKTHGQSDRLRAPGAIGASAYPSRVIKGVKMAGRMGGAQSTIRNLKIAKIDAANNLLYIKGAIPGANGGIVTIRRQER
ncbi:MAG: 50S ribosomal protein L3 [Candidatus Marinimicrobia bacterium CG08_land_8_20_14_0_20_45_22]|nr:MAG: 50S ribosomal protein L3 [Candidatus Marinimicrobia bacterium CG08_land_8_20_14_0_20_45_22]